MTSATGTDEPAPAHHIEVWDVVNGPTRRHPHGGRFYSQQSLVCRCGWSMITIRELADVYVQQHMAGEA